MLKATVIGRATATVKHQSMNGQKLLIVQPQMKNGSPEGDPLMAIDGFGAGVGEEVLARPIGIWSRTGISPQPSWLQRVGIGPPAGL